MFVSQRRPARHRDVDVSERGACRRLHRSQHANGDPQLEIELRRSTPSRTCSPRPMTATMPASPVIELVDVADAVGERVRHGAQHVERGRRFGPPARAGPASATSPRATRITGRVELFAGTSVSSTRPSLETRYAALPRAHGRGRPIRGHLDRERVRERSVNGGRPHVRQPLDRPLDRAGVDLEEAPPARSAPTAACRTSALTSAPPPEHRDARHRERARVRKHPVAARREHGTTTARQRSASRRLPSAFLSARRRRSSARSTLAANAMPGTSAAAAADPALSGRGTPGTANGVGVPQYALCDATVIWCSRKRTTSACSGRSRSASAAARSSASQASHVVRCASSVMPES